MNVESNDHAPGHIQPLPRTEEGVNAGGAPPQDEDLGAKDFFNEKGPLDDCAASFPGGVIMSLRPRQEAGQIRP